MSAVPSRILSRATAGLLALLALPAVLAAPAGAAGAASGRALARSAPRSSGLSLSGIDPKPGARGVAGGAPIIVTFSTTLSASTPLPTLSPTTAGNWSVHGRSLVFTPTTPFVPLSDITLTVPGGAHGVASASHARLRRSITESFHVRDGSINRLQQLLSVLRYSPLSWSSPSAPIAADNPAAQLAAMYQPPKGTFSWESSGWPSELTTLWKPGRYNVFTRGLVMEFQADHGLIPNGRQSAGLWNDLLQAVATGDVNQGGYDYALGDQHVPQSLTIWHDGKVVLHAAANTGIAASPTPDGNFNVYARYRNQVMRGTNPDGSKYADPVQYVAYFNGGDAVHFLPRANYGIPQSLGCIELDLTDAATAWPYLAYGTIVTVIG